MGYGVPAPLDGVVWNRVIISESDFFADDFVRLKNGSDTQCLVAIPSNLANSKRGLSLEKLHHGEI
jgi:hypothetical protein